MRATILVHARRPQDAPALVQTLSRYGTATQTAGAYDAILELDTDPDTLGRTVLEIQDLAAVERTLTLPHVTQEPSR